LADHYFDHGVDVFHRPNSRLYAWLGARLAERRVRGIVLWVHVGCDLWRAEAASLREAFGLPILILDEHEARDIGPRALTRLDAFVESLR
jgi:benzoyl-CoA reductase/2-hydroxyglutaryl-CoA dehydratase subunit BcrC/BadD/HgdB